MYRPSCAPRMRTSICIVQMASLPSRIVSRSLQRFCTKFQASISECNFAIIEEDLKNFCKICTFATNPLSTLVGSVGGGAHRVSTSPETVTPALQEQLSNVNRGSASYNGIYNLTYS